MLNTLIGVGIASLMIAYIFFLNLQVAIIRREDGGGCVERITPDDFYSTNRDITNNIEGIDAVAIRSCEEQVTWEINSRNESIWHQASPNDYIRGITAESRTRLPY